MEQINEASGSGEEFTDQAFPPQDSSLYIGDASIDLFPEEVEMLKNTGFKRVSEYYAG